MQNAASSLRFLKQAKYNSFFAKKYRGITLLSAIYKLFEIVVLNRIKHATRLYNLSICHHMQNAYQTGLCSLMTLFVLQETVNYNSERGSKAYCCIARCRRGFRYGLA